MWPAHRLLSFHWKGWVVSPTAQSPRVLWVGAGQGTSELTSVAGQLENAVQAAGFDPEKRAFAPHLTLGADQGSVLGPSGSAIARGFESRKVATSLVDAVVLMESHLSPQGARYAVLERFPLVSA